MKWYYVRSGKKREGPVSTEELRELLNQEEIEPTTLAWREGMPDWKPISVLLELELPGEQPASEPPPEVVEKEPLDEQQLGELRSDPMAADELRSYLLPAILSTILLCPPFGIPAIIYAVQAEDLRAKGRWEESRLPSRLAKMWILVAIGSALVFWVSFGLEAANVVPSEES